MITHKTVKLPKGTKFYAAIGPYRSLGSSPKFIREVFDNFSDAFEYVKSHSIPEDGQSVFVNVSHPNSLWKEYLDIVSDNGNDTYDFMAYSDDELK